MLFTPTVTSPIVNQTVGGVVLYLRAGRYSSRVKVQPRNPKTTAQGEERAFMAAGSRAWNGAMDQSDRDTWDAS